jgi:hypothetical protein
MTATIDLPTMPPDAARLLVDPRVLALRHKGPNWPIQRLVLPPEEVPVPGESPYLLLSTEAEEDGAPLPVSWVNSPMESIAWGKGSGFPDLEERPRFEEGGPTPSVPLHLRDFSSWLIAGPEAVAILRRFAPESIETTPIDVAYEDSGQVEGYVFLDVRRLVDAYDYGRCEVLVTAYELGRVIEVGGQRGLRADIDRNLHLFRDSFQREHVFVSRELARALCAAGIRQIRFTDPADMRFVEIGT